MGVIEVDAKIGVKLPGPNNTSARSEFSLGDGSFNNTVTYSIKNVELIGAGATVSPNSTDLAELQASVGCVL